MAVSFGLSRLRALNNGLDSGCSIDTTGGAGCTAVVLSGTVWINGKLCTVSGGHDVDVSALSPTAGTKYIFARLATGESSTATLDATSVDPVNNGAVIGTLLNDDGSATSIDVSGVTGHMPFGRAQNCSLTISYDQAVARGGTLVFGNDIKLYNGSIEGQLEYASLSGMNLARILGATWASGGAGSGTMSVSATMTPVPFAVEAQNITNGVTSTVTILKCYSNQITANLERENYTMPTVSFQAVANGEGDIMSWNI